MNSPLDLLAEDRISLVKPDGTVAMSDVKAVVDPYKVMVTRADFPVAAGDTIVREMPAGHPPERYEVSEATYSRAPHEMSCWSIDVRKIGALPAPSRPPASAATNITNYYVRQAAAVGHGAIARDNAVVQHNTTQTLNVDLDLAPLALDLAALRKALLAQAADDEDDHEAADEAARVGKARDAIKAGGNPSIIMSAVKALGSKTWALGENLALAYVNFKLRDQLGLPPGE